MLRFIPAILALFVLVGCGQKGPLYMPDDEAAAERYGPHPTATADDAAEAETGTASTAPESTDTAGDD